MSKRINLPKLSLKNLKKNKVFTKFKAFWKKYPLRVVAATFAIFVLFLIASIIFKSEPELTEEPTPAPLAVKAIRFGEASLTEKTVGTIANTSTITLVAQSSGPVTALKVSEGDQVWRGNIIMQQESAYTAGNARAVQTSIAAKNVELASETLKNTVEVVAKTREQADKNRDNTEELRKISEKSIGDTKGLISTTEEVIKKIEDDIKAEQAGANDANVIQGFRTQLVTFKGVLNQNRSSLRNVEYSVDTDNPPTKLADLQKDVVYKTTEIQLVTAQLQKDIANLNLRVARISEAATRVAAPFEGSIEKIYVEPGQFLNPGDPVAVIRGKTDLQLKVNVAGSLVGQIDQQQPLVISLNGKTISLSIDHISSVPVNGQLFELVASIPESYQQLLFEQQTVDVTLPLYAVSILEGNHFVPLDSVFVTNLNTYVFTVEDGLVKQKIIETGEIVGESIEIKSGLVPGDILILDRRVINGQLVEPEVIKDTSETIIELG